MGIRIIASTLLAVGITLVLFWTMTALIAQEDVALVPDGKHSVVHIVKVREAAPPQPKVRTPLIKPKVDDPPHVAPVVRVIAPGATHGHGPREATIDPFGPNRHRPTLHQADSDAVPLVRVPPRYPERALARGVEGRVLVEFTITRSGQVRDARVIAAEPTSIFDEAALRAVRQWRYAPKVVNGVAVERPGVRISIPFRRGQAERAAPIRDHRTTL